MRICNYSLLVKTAPDLTDNNHIQVSRLLKNFLLVQLHIYHILVMRLLTAYLFERKNKNSEFEMLTRSARIHLEFSYEKQRFYSIISKIDLYITLSQYNNNKWLPS